MLLRKGDQVAEDICRTERLELVLIDLALLEQLEAGRKHPPHHEPAPHDSFIHSAVAVECLVRNWRLLWNLAVDSLEPLLHAQMRSLLL